MVQIRENATNGARGAAEGPAAPPRVPPPVSERERPAGARKTAVAVLSVVSNAVLIVLKVAIGLLIGSVGILSEAIHSGVDLVASLVALFGVRKASEAADDRHPYGHGKFENIAGTVEALLIFAAAVWIVYEAVRKLMHPRALEMPAWGVAVMFVSVVLNLVVAWRLFRVGRAGDSVALQADAVHHQTDVYTSLGVMLGLLVVWIGQRVWPSADLAWIDPVVAIMVALMIMKAAYDLTMQSASDLLDVSLPGSDVDWISGFVKENWPAVRSFHRLRTRKAGSSRFIDFHLAVDDRMSVGEAHRLGDEIVRAIKERLPESHVHIHVEPCAYQCPESCESGCSMTVEARHKSSEETAEE
jgi:cation diffusion facilitator family transporter